MGLRRGRGPYAPQRQGVTFDLAAMEADRQAARAERARVEEDARRRMQSQRVLADPLAQLVERCYAMEQRIEALEQAAGVAI